MRHTLRFIVMVITGLAAIGDLTYAIISISRFDNLSELIGVIALILSGFLFYLTDQLYRSVFK